MGNSPYGGGSAIASIVVAAAVLLVAVAMIVAGGGVGRPLTAPKSVVALAPSHAPQS